VKGDLLVVEHAVYITRRDLLDRIQDEFDRIYFGAEFCARLLPSIDDVRYAQALARHREIAFTLVTPYVTDPDLPKVKGLLEECDAGNEVVCSDWGVLSLVCREYSHLIPVLGRLLNPMKRGPRLMKVADRIPRTNLEYFRESNFSNQRYKEFLAKLGVRRVEFDNVLQGFNGVSKPLQASLLVPFVYVTTTRLCLTANCDDPSHPGRVRIENCGSQCKHYTFYLRHPTLPKTLIRKGNTMFFKNETIPEHLDEKGVDRIVREGGVRP
jgi:hypothetical protein